MTNQTNTTEETSTQEEDLTVEEALDLLDLITITMEHIDEDNKSIIEALDERWPQEKTIRCMKLIRRMVAELGHLV